MEVEVFKPRTRTIPLVPEPFENVLAMKQAVFFGSQRWASESCKFCPNLNILEYMKSMSDEQTKRLEERTENLQKRAIQHQFHESSEFGWEVSAWHDVFDAILDDETFRVDKRPYEYVEKDEEGFPIVKKRIPDATMGLKSYDDYDLERGYPCTVVDCKVDHSSMQPDKRLSCKDLSSMMHDETCGLVVDGVWGKTSLVFPFAVYEAKKRASRYEAAEGQIYHACRTYLAMLDDLARDPDNVAQYQTNESSKYQLFAFTSCGSQWQVFIAWNHFNDCAVETIWKGDVKNWSRAFDLICIIDQIQDYAAHQHRPFVLKHLEAWHSKHQRASESTRLSTDPLSEMNLDDVDSNFSPEPCDFTKWTWMWTKEATRERRQEDALLKRLKRGRTEYNDGTKRGPGRPRKTSRATTRKEKKTRGRSRH
ncbi:hypothetical protein F4679DRAFT_564670 [Xylaria curta]|nr:hypothetical protein F4679DRAFT_564670 [Xylaria curta]